MERTVVLGRTAADSAIQNLHTRVTRLRALNAQHFMFSLQFIDYIPSTV